MSRLRDPFWQFASVAVAILFGIITIYFLLTGRPYKGLRIQVLSNSPLVSVNADIANDIHVLYKDKPVQSLSLILLQLENTGNQPLTEGDYGQPIHISVSP